MTLRSILSLPPDEAAVLLLGSTLRVTSNEGEITGGIIVEVEAYFSENDAAAHFARGKRDSNASMFKGLGSLYVHPHRHHTLFDVITEHKGRPGAILFRAIQPTVGIEIMSKRTQKESVYAISNGPAKLCKALGIAVEHNGINILDVNSPIKIIPGKTYLKKDQIAVSTRIGITKNADAELRFSIKDSPFISDLPRVTLGRSEADLIHDIGEE